MLKQKISVFFLAFVLLFCSIYMITDAAPSKVLPLNQALLKETGRQDSRGEACSCYALAYCRTILDGKAHKFSEYNQNGDTEFNVVCVWSSGDYYPVTAGSRKEVLDACYESINQNRPLIIHVKTKYSQHWVTVVGYQGVEKKEEMTEQNLLIIDPLYGYDGTPAVNAYAFYDYRYITTDKGSAAAVPAEKDTEENGGQTTQLTGDADGNGKVDAADALLVLKYAAQLDMLSLEALKRADVDANGSINAADALDILKYSAKLTDAFEADLRKRFNAQDAVFLPLTGQEDFYAKHEN